MTGTRHLISLDDLSDDQFRQIIDRGLDYATGTNATHQPLSGRVIGIYFRKTSTRTRSAFSTAALRLGAQIVAYGPDDLQTSTGETLTDTGRVLSGMLDGLVVRTAGDPAELRDLASQDRMAVINAMSADEHPTQALADLTTLLQQFGRLDHLRVLYVGEGNNTATALARALTRFPGTELHLRTPRGYGLDPATLHRAHQLALEHHSHLDEQHHLEELPGAVDVVYTTRWQTTGTTKPGSGWRDAFALFQVSTDLMNRWPAAVFMHDLPAHRGEEVTAEVLDGARSIAFTQSDNKHHSACAVLEWCLTHTAHKPAVPAARVPA